MDRFGDPGSLLGETSYRQVLTMQKFTYQVLSAFRLALQRRERYTQSSPAGPLHEVEDRIICIPTTIIHLLYL
jgi:hypothetical protein